MVDLGEIALEAKEAGREHRASIAETLLGLAYGHTDLGSFAEAKAAAARAHALLRFRDSRANPSARLIKPLVALGDSYYELGRVSMAQRYYERALAILDRDHSLTFVVRANLANCYSDLGEFHRAKEVEEDVVSFKKTHLGRTIFALRGRYTISPAAATRRVTLIALCACTNARSRFCNSITVRIISKLQ